MNYIMKHRKHRCKRLRHELPWTSAMFYPNSLEFFVADMNLLLLIRYMGMGQRICHHWTVRIFFLRGSSWFVLNLLSTSYPHQLTNWQLIYVILHTFRHFMWHSIWHFFLAFYPTFDRYSDISSNTHSISHVIWHISLPSIWHFIWHSCWHI